MRSVFHHRHGQVHLVRPHGFRAGRNRIQPWRQRAQCGDQFGGVPRGGKLAQEIDRLVAFQQGGELGALLRSQQALQTCMPRGCGLRRDQRTGQSGDFALLGQPARQRQVLAAMFDFRSAIQPQRRQPLLDQRRRVARPHADRITGFVTQARTFQRQFDMPHVAPTVARDDALVLQHGGGERLLARVCRHRAHRVQCRALTRSRRGHVERLAGCGEGAFGPACRRRLEIHVGLAQLGKALSTQLGQPRIQRLADRAVLRVTRIAQAQHGELQLRQLRCALAGDELDETHRIVRRIAVTLAADHHAQEALLGQLAQRVGAGAQQSHRQAGGLGAGRQLLGHTAGVAGLAAIDDGQPPARVRRLLAHARQAGRNRAASGSRGAVRRDPVQVGRCQAVGQAGQQRQPLRIERRCRRQRFQRSVHGNSFWTSLRPYDNGRFRFELGESICRHVVMSAAHFLRAAGRAVYCASTRCGCRRA